MDFLSSRLFSRHGLTSRRDLYARTGPGRIGCPRRQCPRESAAALQSTQRTRLLMKSLFLCFSVRSHSVAVTIFLVSSVAHVHTALHERGPHFPRAHRSRGLFSWSTSSSLLLLSIAIRQSWKAKQNTLSLCVSHFLCRVRRRSSPEWVSFTWRSTRSA